LPQPGLLVLVIVLMWSTKSASILKFLLLPLQIMLFFPHVGFYIEMLPVAPAARCRGCYGATTCWARCPCGAGSTEIHDRPKHRASLRTLIRIWGRVTESQNGRGWKGPLWVIWSNSRQGHLQQAAQDLVQAMSLMSPMI